MSSPKKISLDGGNSLGQSAFSSLDALKSSLPAGPVSPAAGSASVPIHSKELSPAPQKNRGRVDIVRSTAGRGGKTVTLVQGFVGIGQMEKEVLAKKMQKRCGCGGTVKDGHIEIQGDKREEIAEILKEAGFRPVFAGG
ncbi:MAG TPA: translation initiation factor [Opitutaceae bacterium]|nr:translation initiation factor [Opitutaceae bacterium]